MNLVLTFRKGTLRDSKTLTWSVNSNNFNFKDDNGSPYVEFNSLFDLKFHKQIWFYSN